MCPIHGVPKTDIDRGSSFLQPQLSASSGGEVEHHPENSTCILNVICAGRYYECESYWRWIQRALETLRKCCIWLEDCKIPYKSYTPCPPYGKAKTVDTLGFEPRAFRMRSGCDITTPCALEWHGHRCHFRTSLGASGAEHCAGIRAQFLPHGKRM